MALTDKKFKGNTNEQKKLRFLFRAGLRRIWGLTIFPFIPLKETKKGKNSQMEKGHRQSGKSRQKDKK